jgi:four helix bundle protein
MFSREQVQTPEDAMAFDHEKLDVYKLAVQHVATADDIANQLPKGRSYLASQLRRAALSIPLNIAEGAGEYAAAEKKRFYRIARRSATECAAALDVAAVLGCLAEPLHQEARSTLLRLVQMLTKMSK